jgi:hypothetical protein
MMILVMEYGNVYSIGAISQTRADAIADSTAVYAVSYDSTYNRRAAYEQGTMLTAYNSGERTPIASEIQVLPDDAGKNTKLEVKVAAQGHFFFPGYAGAEIFEVTRESAVEVVDMSGGVIIIP